MPEPQAPPRIAPAAADTLTVCISSPSHCCACPAGASRPVEALVNEAATVGFGRCLECRVLFGACPRKAVDRPGALRPILLHVEAALHHPAPDNGPLAIQFHARLSRRFNIARVISPV